MKRKHTDISIACPICIDVIDNSTINITLECGHRFHFMCIRTWKQINSTCPTCRHIINIHDFRDRKMAESNDRSRTAIIRSSIGFIDERLNGHNVPSCILYIPDDQIIFNTIDKALNAGNVDLARLAFEWFQKISNLKPNTITDSPMKITDFSQYINVHVIHSVHDIIDIFEYVMHIISFVDRDIYSNRLCYKILTEMMENISEKQKNSIIPQMTPFSPYKFVQISDEAPFVDWAKFMIYVSYYFGILRVLKFMSSYISETFQICTTELFNHMNSNGHTLLANSIKQVNNAPEIIEFIQENTTVVFSPEDSEFLAGGRMSHFYISINRR